MKTKFRRLQAGYYYTTQAITFDGIETHVVIEANEAGTFWMLRLESFPGMTSIHGTVKHCKLALRELMSGNRELVS